jgi:serine/threonine protein kinase
MTGGEGAHTGAHTGAIIGGHQVGTLIGAGPLAEVYETRHPALAQPLALKIFAPGIAAHTAYVETMREIAASAQRLRAAHILPVYDFARDDDHLYLSMPLMRGSLRNLLQRANRLPLAQAIALLRQIAAGLAPAHAAGIVHRDLKPENVLFDTHGHAFISDFGVGRDLPPGGTQHTPLDTLSSLIGLPAYMAPEQLRGLPTDQRSDVYALGVILYEILTGDPPFSGATIYEVAALALTMPIPPLAQRGAIMPPLLERAILRALSRDPTGRWPTAQRFIVGIEATLPAHLPQADAPGHANHSETGTDQEASDAAPDQPVSPPLIPPLLSAITTDDPARPAPDADAPAVVDEIRDEIEETALANLSLGGSSTGVLRDLRLFRVDPLPPLPARRRPIGLLLIGVVFLLLGALAAGGALLAHAAQTSQGNPVATPTQTTTSALPTQFIIDPLQTAQPVPTAKPTAVPTHPPAPRPTATPKPKPQPTMTPAPQSTATPSVTPSTTP